MVFAANVRRQILAPSPHRFSVEYRSTSSTADRNSTSTPLNHRWDYPSLYRRRQACRSCPWRLSSAAKLAQSTSQTRFRNASASAPQLKIQARTHLSIWTTNFPDYECAFWKYERCWTWSIRNSKTIQSKPFGRMKSSMHSYKKKSRLSRQRSRPRSKNGKPKR